MRNLVLLIALVAALPAAAAPPRILPSQDIDPVWSPDGTRIAFTRVSATGMTLEVVDLATRKVRQVAANAAKLQPSWSPDGTQLALQARGKVWVADVGGKGLDPVTPETGLSFAPAWSPDGARIAYLSTRKSPSGATNLWSSAPDGSGDVQLASRAIGVPAWSPDSQSIAFQRDGGIYVAAGGGVEGELMAVPNPGPPAWSHDGRLVAFAAQRRVWVADVTGKTAPRAVSPFFDGIGTPSWSAGDDAVVYARAGGLELTLLSGRSGLLVPFKIGGGGLAAYSPTAELVAFSGPRAACPGHRSIHLYVNNARKGSITGTCAVVGTPRGDVIEGSAEPGDVILAGAGNDAVHANDRHSDRVDCGAGYDTVWADPSDRLRGCERIHR